MMQIVSITVITPGGGVFKALTSPISPLFNACKLFSAASSAGNASFKSFWASSDIAWLSSFNFVAFASSSSTLAFVSSAMTCQFKIM